MGFTIIYAGPYAGLHLADLGADVIKVEPPGGDPRRHVGAVVPENSKVFQYLNRAAGWEHVHVAVDHSRLAYAEVLPSDDRAASIAFLRRALAWYREQGVAVEGVMTDNAGAHRSRAWRAFCAERGVRHLGTRPYTPRTNGKAEALIKTLLREWAYRFAYPLSHHRTRAVGGWLRWYNRRRPHSSLGGKPPTSRVSHLCGQYN